MVNRDTCGEKPVYLSVHGEAAMEKARRMGAFAGARETAELWKLSKRELVELALRLTRGNNVEEAVAGAKEELEILRANGIL